jgi:putative ABC transport system ATP-binding protein
MSSALIRLVDVAKTYQTKGLSTEVLMGVTLNIAQGEFVAIMGSSGSGKTSLLNIIGCLDQPTSGSYYFKDTALQELTDNEISALRSHEIGYIFQSFNLLPRLTARRNVELPLIYQKIRAATRRELAEAMLARVGLDGKSQRLPSELSGGEQQRVAIARALLVRPSLLLADEPTGNLDSRTGIEIMNIIKNLHQSGITIVMVTHDRSLSNFAERRLVMKDGHLLPSEIEE